MISWPDRVNVDRIEQGSPVPQTNQPRAVSGRFVGIDIGTETIKLVELCLNEHGLQWTRQQLIEHGKQPAQQLLNLLQDWDWAQVQSAAVTGRISRQINLVRVPSKQAQARGFRFLFGNKPATIVSIGNHGFSVLELRENGLEVFRENNRCSQGTGNFLRQLVERFGLSVAEASELCADVDDPAPLSGRCPVILKTDMTHLANKGENCARILAGLFDAVCENVMALIKPGTSPIHVYLIGGVSQARRVQNTLGRLLQKAGLTLMPLTKAHALFLEALGTAVVAAEQPSAVPALESILVQVEEAKFVRVPPLHDALRLVRRLPIENNARSDGKPVNLILGFDIGSTGSKLVALDTESGRIFWQGYRCTAGDPVGAAKALLKQFVTENTVNRNAAGALAAGNLDENPPLPQAAFGGKINVDRVVGFGVTGSGREIVGSLLITCYGKDAVFILNEIVAHAEGALHYDKTVDTIFEIGGQDAKYIRLANGRVVDCAMNEACSAGTGSFIEEQGKKFIGVQHVAQLSQFALRAKHGVSLGQHCSVFMAEVIDEAVAAGIAPEEIIAGLYDSIVQNYLHRVKGQRQVGKVIFCQGMPFSSDALAAAVARQTGSRVIIPPYPGIVGALGIALLARRELPWQQQVGLDLGRFLNAQVERRETFVCKANTGCGGSGNKCKIDCIYTVVDGHRQRFTWGGGCSLYDKGTRKKKLPDHAPDPFREREELVAELLARLNAERHRVIPRQRIAISDEFTMKGLFPFFATFLHELGFELVVPSGADQATLKRGIQEANVPFCAPMQLFHGLASRMAEDNVDFIFLPMIRATPRTAGETTAVVCPIAQASPDILRWHLKPKTNAKIVAPVVDIGQGNLQSAAFIRSCNSIAVALGVNEGEWRRAYRIATQTQLEFDAKCIELGKRTLQYCAQNDIVPVVVLGRPYTIYNRVLNSNVPALLREQGAIGIPVDCYPIEPVVPVFNDVYWGYSQRILRAAYQIRRAPGVYSLFCSNYACGPDSFTLHFYSYIMEGKPFAIIETDGHSGDAGTKTRIEAFLYCADQDKQHSLPQTQFNDLRDVEVGTLTIANVKLDQHFLIPMLGPCSDVLGACLRGLGYAAETMPMPDAESLRLGRRYTSGKECLPMCLTLGCLLKQLESGSNKNSRFVLVMPRTRGPCRFGVYNVLNRITLKRLRLDDRVAIWSPRDTGYFENTPPAFAALVFTGFMAAELLQAALLDTRPCEPQHGVAQAIYDRYNARLLQLCEKQAQQNLSVATVLREIFTARFFGITQLLRQAAAEFAAIKKQVEKPTVLVAGEIYVRLVPFANDFIIEKLEARGCKTRLAPGYEWLEYVDYLNRCRGNHQTFSARLTSFIQRLIQSHTYAIMANALGWQPHVPVVHSLHAAKPYLRQELEGEAVLTVGTPLCEWRLGLIDAAVSVGPLECMPNKIAEAQFFHVVEQEGLPTLTISLIGDPMNIETLDNFVFEVKHRFFNRRLCSSQPNQSWVTRKQSKSWTYQQTHTVD